MFGIYVGINKAISGLALVVIVPIMKYKFKMSDTTIILVGIVSSSSCELVFGLSTRTWITFLGKTYFKITFHYHFYVLILRDITVFTMRHQPTSHFYTEITV